jgi:amino acid transporter
MARTTDVLKALLVGRPKVTERTDPIRLSKRTGLGMLAPNNLSSSAYATEEMLVVLAAAGGAAALRYSLPVVLAVAAVVAMVAFSYRQTTRVFPRGGGAYTSSHTYLGKHPGLVAASALLTDHVLTVAVSVSAAVAALVAVLPDLDPFRVALALGAIWLLTLVNLRGASVSPGLLSLPTYAFLFLVGGTVIAGLFGMSAGEGSLAPVQPAPSPATSEITLALLLTAFARACVAATGIESIAGETPTFKEPAQRNAGATLLGTAALLTLLVVGISVLSRSLGIFEPTETQTVLARLVEAVWGEGPVFVAVLAATALILLIAANTTYREFPRLGAKLARDRYWPRQFMNRGDRLAYSNGILGLALVASILVFAFGADVSSLINLYVIGVFTALTLNQAGMVQHWRARTDAPGRRVYTLLNAIGALVAATVGTTVLVARFTQGGWIVVLAIATLVVLMLLVNGHYTHVRRELRDPGRAPRRDRANHVVLLVGDPTEEEARAFYYADRIRTDDFHAVHVARPDDPKGLEAQWVRQIGLLPTSPALEIVREPGSLPSAIRTYVDRTRNRIGPEDFITVIVSEKAREGRLIRVGTPRGLRIKTSLLFAPDVVVTDVPYFQSVHQHALGPGQQARHVVVLLVAAAHNATLQALEYAKTLDADEVHAVHVELDPEMTAHHCQEWDWLETGYEIRVVPSPYRRLGQTLRDYVRSITTDQDAIVTVVLAEFLVHKWWQHLLHNQNALDVKLTFLSEPNVVVTSVPYRLHH